MSTTTSNVQVACGRCGLPSDGKGRSSSVKLLHGVIMWDKSGIRCFQCEFPMELEPYGHTRLRQAMARGGHYLCYHCL